MDDLLEKQQTRIWLLEERIRFLEEVLTPTNVVIPLEWRLTAAEARVFSHLTTKPQCTKESIMAALYGLKPNTDEPEIKIVDVFVCKLRKKLRPFGVKIVTVWGQGYGLQNRDQFVGEAS